MTNLCFTFCSFFLLLQVFACSGDKHHSEPLFTNEVKVAITRDFNNVNDQALNRQDSCLLIRSFEIDSFYTTPLVKNIYNKSIRNYTNRYLNFSFAIVTDENLNNEFFWAFDMFYLRSNKKSLQDSAKLISFKNENLTLITSRFIELNGLDATDAKIKLTNFLYELYFENVQGVSKPFFDQVLEVWDLKQFVSETVYNEITSEGKENLIIFMDSTSGVIVFKWTLVDGKVHVEEVLVPFRITSYLRPDVVPDFAVDCR